MFEQNVSIESGLVKSVTSEKNIIISASLLMRLFEWCHEEAQNDVAMHKVLEKIMSFNDGVNSLTIDTYDVIVANANDGQECDKCSDGTDLENAFEIGQKFAENEIELNSNGSDYSNVAGTILSTVNDNGTSNDELEAFWNGYEGEPLKSGCFTEFDISNYVKKPIEYNIKGEPQFNHIEPTTISLNCEDNDYCQSSENNNMDGLDEETLKRIDEIIGISRI